MWPHVTTCVKEYVTLLLIGFHCKAPACTFGCNWSTESGDTIYVICHAISQYHMIKEWRILTVIYFLSKFGGYVHCSSGDMVLVIEKQYSTYSAWKEKGEESQESLLFALHVNLKQSRIKIKCLVRRSS